MNYKVFEIPALLLLVTLVLKQHLCTQNR